jgi:uncharacterized iron-regulated membrane protein
LGARGVRLQRRLHGAAGIYTLVMLLVLSGTGAALAFPATVRAWMGLPAGGPPRMPRSAADAGAPLPDLDRALALAQQAAPGTRLRMMAVPAAANEPVRLMLLRPGAEGAAGTVTVVADPATGRVLSVQDPATGSAADRAWRWMHDLHEGAGLGPVWRILTVGGGLGLAILTVTGPFMWWLKRRQRKRPMPRALAAPVTE